MKTYLLVYLGSAILVTGLMPVIIFIAKSLNIYDDLNVRKVHTSAIPRIGGVAIVVGMMGLVIPVLLLNNVIGQAFRAEQGKLIALLGAAVFMFLVGLLDDICHLRVRTKLLAQIVAAATICGFGIRIETLVLADWFTIDFGWYSWPITLLWIVGVTNAVNLIDGLDGLAAGISAITCAVLVCFSWYVGQPIMTVLMLALLGSLTGFLFYNFYPARIFMGDGGSLFLGFVLAGASVLCTTKSAMLVGLALPTLALGIPIFDTFFTILRRFLERRSIFSPDRSHFHHRLLDMGIHHRHAVIIIYMVTLLTAGLGMFMMATRNIGTVFLFGGLVGLLMVVFRLVGVVRLREVMAGIRRKILMARRAKEQKRDFETARILMRQASSMEQWWRAVRDTAEQMDIAWLSLPLKNAEGVDHTLRWRRPGPEPAPDQLIDITLPVRQKKRKNSALPGDQEPENGLRLSLALEVDQSLEVASGRLALFSRLIDEYGLEDLPSIRRARDVKKENAGLDINNYIPSIAGYTGDDYVKLKYNHRD